MKMIIAIGGLAGSGKDTACDYLVEKHGFKKTSFAAPLKQMAKIAFGFTDEQLYGPSSKREEQDERYPLTGPCLNCGHLVYPSGPPDEKPEPGKEMKCFHCGRFYPRFVNARIALQTLGTEWGRRLHHDIWAKAAINMINTSEHERWCISDMRFENEFDAVRTAQGFTVRLMRGELQHQHASETELLTIPLEWFSKVLDNRGSVPELYNMLDEMIAEFATLRPCPHGKSRGCDLCDFDVRLEKR